MAPPLSIAVCRKPDARTSSMNLLTGGQRDRPVLRHDNILRDVEQIIGQEPRSGRAPHQRRQALTVRWDRVDFAGEQFPAYVRRVVGKFDHGGAVRCCSPGQRDDELRVPAISCPARSISAMALSSTSRQAPGTLAD